MVGWVVFRESMLHASSSQVERFLSDGTPDSVKHEALSVCEASLVRAVPRPGKLADGNLSAIS